MKKILILTALLSLCSASALCWEKDGHDISTRIAEKYLTKKAKKNIESYLDGQPISFYASYMDYMGYVYKLGYSNDWFDHTVPVDKDFNYCPEYFPQVGDAEYAIEVAVDKMKDGGYKNLPDSLVNLYIKHLVHFVPDYHCPSHIIYNFRPSNYLMDVRGEQRLFHWVWDNFPTGLGLHSWSAGDYCEHLTANLTKEKKAQIEAGTTRDWVKDNATSCIVAYDISREKDSLSDVDSYNGTVLVDEQLLKGGIRLAYLLNMIFGK